MTNFLLGAVAGALFACVGTIAAVRQPEIQTRLGLRPAAMLAAARKVGSVEMLLSPRRFWWIAP
ncbi:hypothetical protein [Methylobacterium sp. CCH5-D2]|uniref:hypothetical protein n=1 Tax=Methylobacterium sp. CCH5-D2 TaxID=1768765 RepID=UPI00082A4C8F|nr:hypothetical protein [Methylobacterium sp. CCH5-D2]